MLFVAAFINHTTAQESRPKVFVPGLPLSIEEYPILVDTVVSKDGKEFPLAYRKPLGDGPFPVMLFFHGGRGGKPKSIIGDDLKKATPTRFLKKGYMIVDSTRRGLKPGAPREEIEDPKSYSGGMIYDGIAAVQKTKTLPGADPESIVIFGSSVGGSLAIETAAQTTIAAVVAAEPTSSLWMGPKITPASFGAEQFPQFYTDDVRDFVRSVIGEFSSPFLLLHGDPSGLRRADFSYLMRELEDLGKQAKSIGYAGYKHGFYNGGGARQMTAQELDEVIEDIHTFVFPHLKTKPEPL